MKEFYTKLKILALLIMLIYLSYSYSYSEQIINDFCDSVSQGSPSGNQEDDNPSRQFLGLKDKIKLRSYWIFWETHKDKYGSYKEFLESWDSNNSIRYEIKKDIKVEKEKLIVFKRSIGWFLGLRKASRYRNSPFSNDRE